MFFFHQNSNYNYGLNSNRIRNPWGNDVEWKGAWSDSSSEWRSISNEDKNEVGFEKSADGEFW